MSLAEAAAALDRVLQQSKDPSSLKYPPQLPPPPQSSTLPVPRVSSVPPVGNGRKIYPTSAGKEKSYPHMRTIYAGEGFRMPDHSLPVNSDIPPAFCGSRYSNGRFQIVFSDSESKAYANSIKSFRRNEFLTNDFGKRPMKRDIFSSIPTFPFRDMVSRPYMRNCEFYQGREYRYRTSHAGIHDDMNNYKDCFYSEKDRYETELGNPRGDDFRCDWSASSRSLTKFRGDSRPFLDRCPLPDGNWQPRCAVQSRVSKKPFSGETERGPLLRIMGPPSKFRGHERSRSTTSLRSRLTSYEDYPPITDYSGYVVPIPRSAKASVHAMPMTKVDMARPRIIKNTNPPGSFNTYVGKDDCFSGDRRRSKSLSASSFQSDPNVCRQNRQINEIEPIESNSLTPLTVSGKCALPDACSSKSSGLDDGHLDAPNEQGSGSRSIMKPKIIDYSKDVQRDASYAGPQARNKTGSKSSLLNFACGTSSGLVVLHPISYRTETSIESCTMLKQKPNLKSDVTKEINENSMKQENEFDYTNSMVTEVKAGNIKVAKFESVREDEVSLTLEKDKNGQNLSNPVFNFQETLKSSQTTDNASLYKDLKTQSVGKGLDCCSVNLNASKTWNSSFKNANALCRDVTFSGNFQIEEHPDVIMNDACKDWFGCNITNYFEDPNCAEADKHCSLSQEKNEENGRKSIYFSIHDNSEEINSNECDLNSDLTHRKAVLNRSKLDEMSSDGKLDFSRALDLLCSAKNRNRYEDEFCNSGNMNCVQDDTSVVKDELRIRSQAMGNSSSDMSEFLMNAEKNGLVASSPKKTKQKITSVDTTCNGKIDCSQLIPCDPRESKNVKSHLTSGSVCDNDEISCRPASTATYARIPVTDNATKESPACLPGSKPSFISSNEEMIEEVSAVEGEESLIKYKLSSSSDIYSQQLHGRKFERDSGETNGILCAVTMNGNVDPLPLNGRLPQLRECDHETSSEGSDEINHKPNGDDEPHPVLNIQVIGLIEKTPSEDKVSNSLDEKSFDEHSNSKIEKSLVSSGRDLFFSEEHNESKVRIFDLDQQEGSSKDSKESEDFHPLDPSKYKTELCRAFQIRGTCRYGTRCNYAHGLDQLKVSFHHGKYKTRNCQAYHETGYCRYGARCSFIHDLEEGILKCSIANKEILEALHHWPEDDSAPSATVTWKVFNKRRGDRACLDETLIEFTAIPSIKPADLGPDCDLNSDEDNPSRASRVYTLDSNRYSVRQNRRSFRRDSARLENADDVPSLKRKTSSFGSTSCRGPRQEASVIEVKKSCAELISEEKKPNLVKCKDPPVVEKRQSMIRNSVKDLMTLIKAVEPRYSGNTSNSYSSRNMNFALPSVGSSRRSSKVDVTFGENLGDGSIHASVSFRKEEHPRRTYQHGHGDDFGSGEKYSRDCSRDSRSSESRPVLATKRKCFSFHYKGFCLYGPECQFLHDE